jgi:Kef-type K+ transport system membrane component KefB
VWKSLYVYVAVTVVFGSAIALGLHWGRNLETRTSQLLALAPPPADGGNRAMAILLDNLDHPLGLLLLQLIVVILAARIFGVLFQRFGQPAVIGEIVAGIVLGPSVFGATAPGVFAFLFAPSSLSLLKLFAEIGVVLFLFVVGLELELPNLRRMAPTALVISHASIVVPYALGVLLSLLLYRELAPPGVTFLAFALFMGIAMSLTAFPVLARILSERRLTRTYLGTTAITCAAVGDVTAWSILALVVAIVGAQGVAATALTVLFTVLFSVMMIWGVRPVLARMVERRGWDADPGKTAMAAVLVVTLASALTTEVIGIHALFGAFLAGAVMPRAANLRHTLTERLEELSSVFLLPVFFAFTGLRTHIGLVTDRQSWMLCLLIIVVAMVGKLGASMLAARLTFFDWIDSFALGALMNTRGLIELIALNVGYELGILSPRIFTMMVLMALTTTLTTGPLLSLADALRRRRPVPPGPDPRELDRDAAA